VAILLALFFLCRKAENTYLSEKKIAQAIDCFYSLILVSSLMFQYPYLSGGETARCSTGTRDPFHLGMCILEKQIWGQI